MTTSFSKHLRKWRDTYGLTQAEATEALQGMGVTVELRTLQNWEQGRLPDPNTERLVEILTSYDLTALPVQTEFPPDQYTHVSPSSLAG